MCAIADMFFASRNLNKWSQMHRFKYNKYIIKSCATPCQAIECLIC